MISLKAAPYVAIAVLVALLLAAGVTLRHAWEASATKQTQLDQTRQALAEQQRQYQAARAQQKRNDQIVATVTADKQRLEAQNHELSQQIRNAPDASPAYTACRNVPLPGSVVQRLRAAAGHTNPDRQTATPASPIPGGVPGARHDGPDH